MLCGVAKLSTSKVFFFFKNHNQKPLKGSNSCGTVVGIVVYIFRLPRKNKSRNKGIGCYCFCGTKEKPLKRSSRGYIFCLPFLARKCYIMPLASDMHTYFLPYFHSLNSMISNQKTKLNFRN